MADPGGVSEGTVVAVAVLGAVATVAASGIAILGHWFADRRLGAHDLHRARRDAYARYLAVQQRALTLQYETATTFRRQAELVETTQPSIVQAVNAARDEARTSELRDLLTRIRRLGEEGATALYAAVLVAGVEVREALISDGGGVDDAEVSVSSFSKPDKLRESAANMTDMSTRTAKNLRRVEAAMRKELGS